MGDMLEQYLQHLRNDLNYTPWGAPINWKGVNMAAGDRGTGDYEVTESESTVKWFAVCYHKNMERSEDTAALLRSVADAIDDHFSDSVFLSIDGPLVIPHVASGFGLQATILDVVVDLYVGAATVYVSTPAT